MTEPKILNVGCGNDIHGTDFVDIFPFRKEVKKCNLDTERLPYENNTFDEVKCHCVLEHLRNVGFVLNEINRVLKKGGVLNLVTDNANYWNWAINKTHLGGYEKESLGGVEDKHFSLFTDWHLKNHLKDSGFKKIRMFFELDKQTNSFQRKVIFLINNFLIRTPFRRLGYYRIDAIAIK